MSIYLSKEVTPDLINGDVSSVIQSDKSDKPFSSGDILFDWTAFELPGGGAKLNSIAVYITGEDGATAAEQDMYLYFAKTVNGAAPDSLGSVNAAMSTGFNFPKAILGGIKLEGGESNSQLLGPAFGDVLGGVPYSAHGLDGTVIFTAEEGQPGLGGVGNDTFYVCGFAGGAYDFSTGVLVDGAITSDTETSITVKSVDPRKCFQIGDEVYVHDVDTAIGTIKSMTSTNITLNAAIAGGTDIADEDELVNANPIRIKLGFVL